VILFLDSSALVKLYSAEANRKVVFSAIAKARDVAVSSLSLAEVASALKRHQLEGGFSQADEQLAFQVLLEDWETFDRIDLSDWLAKQAAVLARSKGLRGADAVQLASASWLTRERHGVQFLAFDVQLNEAARGIVRIFEP
jgi:uncharacterized protein